MNLLIRSDEALTGHRSKTGSVFDLGCTPRRQSADGVSALPKTGIAALVVSLLRRALGTFFGHYDLQISRQIVRSHPASRTYVRQRVRTDKKGAPLN